MDDEDLDGKLYKNWVRGAKGLEFLQTGLKDFVGKKAPECRDKLLQNVTNSPIGSLPHCNQCNSQNLLPEHANPKNACRPATCIQRNSSNCFGSKPRGRRKCPNGICSKFYDAIVYDHCYNDPLWKNTNPTTWCSDPGGWSFAKCFETTRGPGSSAQETDASGLLSVLLNNRFMQNWLACHNMGSNNNSCPFYKARYIRNEILHKSKMELEDLTLDEYIDTFITVLEDPKCLLTYAGAQDAVIKLKQLKSKQIHISQKDENDILKIRKEALSELEDEKNEALRKIQGSTDEGVAEMNKTKVDALQEIEKKESTGITAMSEKTTEALKEIEDTTSTVLTAVSKERLGTLKELKETTSTGITAIKATRTDALKEMEEKIGTGLTRMNKTKTEAEQEITEMKRITLNEVSTTGTETLGYIDDRRDEILSELEGVKSDIFEELKKQKPLNVTTAGKENTPSTGAQSSTTIYVSCDTSGANAVEDDESDTKKTKTVLDKAWGKLIDFMNPDPILKCATEYDLFGYRQTRDISGEKNTTDKNRKILENVTRKGKTGYEDFKECLYKTDHSKLALLLEYIERGEDTSSLLKQIQLLKEFQDDLISFYRRQHSKITLSPLVDEDTPLLEFYVTPELQTVEIKRARGGGKEEKYPVGKFRNVFYKGNKMCNEIYLSADAGYGKTAFSKLLTLAWCHAKKPSEEGQYFLEEEIKVMNEFRFVFLLLLRDSPSQCNIDDMISNQIVSKLGRTYSQKDLEDITSKETCLVILDGLDEWTHPSQPGDQGESKIPHRKVRERTAILTTSRPWKLGGLKSSDIDQRLEISGLNQESTNTLKRSVISHLSGTKDENTLKKDVDDFSRAVREKQISDLEAIPLLLIYMLFLWHYGIDLGQSQCDLYSKIVELLLSRTVQNNKDKLPQAEPPQGDIPICFSEQKHCKQFYTYLTALGHLAFQTLLKESKEEHTLVFDSSIAEHYLNKQCLSFCLSTGIITQSKVQGNPLKQESKVSFAHKTVQEYFAALYMSSTPDQTPVPETVLSKCKCVKDILDMSKVLIFLSGFNANVLSVISRELIEIINKDELTREYRNSPVLEEYNEPLEQFQDMCVSCCKELPDNNEVSLCLQDVFIDKSYQQEQYCEHLKQLTTRNKQNIRSLYIDMSKMKDTPYNSARKVIEDFGLNDLENVEKIYYDGKYNDGDILPLLNSSVKSLCLSCSSSSLSPSLYHKVKRLQQLEAIGISGFRMSHEQLTLLYDYITQRHCLREIELLGLCCTDHGESCTGSRVDLSQHSHLRTLTLDRIPVSHVHINMAAIEWCSLEDLSNPDVELRFVNCVPADSKVKSFEGNRQESPAAMDDLNIPRVNLFFVKISAQAVRGMADSALTLPQPVRVDMMDCTITPSEECETWKTEIRNSPRFRVETHDEVDWFWFVTIKD